MKPWHILLVITLSGTLALGLLLRWALAGELLVTRDFAHLRHAHSHLGYFGVLFPLAWMAWKAAGVSALSNRTIIFYGAAVLVSFFGFLRAGYGVEAIVGSTCVGLVWMLSAWPLRQRMRAPRDLLGAIPLGIISAFFCVPPIAYFVRRDPGLTHQFVATFLAILLLGVIVPSALAPRRVDVIPWPIMFASAVFGALALGVWPHSIAHAGLFVYGLLLLRVALSNRLSMHLRLAWSAVGAGLVLVAIGWLPNTRSVALGAIHFLILGPVLATLSLEWFRRPLPAWFWGIEFACVALLSAPLIWTGFGRYGMLLSAIGGTATVTWWVATLVYQARR